MQHHLHDRARLELLHALATDITPCDAQDLMSWPDVSFAKSLRVAPIDFRMSEVTISAEATVERNVLRERRLAVAYVRAGADILLNAGGWPNVETMMKNIGAVEAIGTHPVDISPDCWRHFHSRLAARDAPRSYIRQRHAWLLRSRIEP